MKIYLKTENIEKFLQTKASLVNTIVGVVTSDSDIVKIKLTNTANFVGNLANDNLLNEWNLLYKISNFTQYKKIVLDIDSNVIKFSGYQYLDLDIIDDLDPEFYNEIKKIYFKFNTAELELNEIEIKRNCIGELIENLHQRLENNDNLYWKLNLLIVFEYLFLFIQEMGDDISLEDSLNIKLKNIIKILLNEEEISFETGLSSLGKEFYNILDKLSNNQTYDLKFIFLSSPLREKEWFLYNLLKKMKSEIGNEFLAKSSNRMKISYFHTHKDNRKPTYDFIFGFLNTLDNNAKKDEYLNFFNRFNEVNSFLAAVSKENILININTFFSYRQTIPGFYLDMSEFYIDILIPMSDNFNINLRFGCSGDLNNQTPYSRVGLFTYNPQIEQYSLNALYRTPNMLPPVGLNQAYYIIKWITIV